MDIRWSLGLLVVFLPGRLLSMISSVLFILYRLSLNSLQTKILFYKLITINIKNTKNDTPFINSFIIRCRFDLIPETAATTTLLLVVSYTVLDKFRASYQRKSFLGIRFFF